MILQRRSSQIVAIAHKIQADLLRMRNHRNYIVGSFCKILEKYSIQNPLTIY